MSNLLNALRAFDRTVDESYYTAKDSGSNEKLEKLFDDLTYTIIYRGHLQINGRFDIYVRSVEFYFHTEDKEHDSKFIHDPVMFHRSSIEGEESCNPRFFTLGHFYLHQFGLDITFEKVGIYRASALIKSFNVVDNSGVFGEQDFREKASSYIYDYIQFKESDVESNGDIHIEWIDDEAPVNASLSDRCPRVGIFEYKIDNGIQTNEKTDKRDNRPWRFYRAEPYNKLSRLLDARKH